jgi:hypothetical protein
MAQKKINIKLDGRQSYSFPVTLQRNNRILSESVDVFVRGFLKFESVESVPASEEATQESILKSFKNKGVIYPVLFTFTQIKVYNGRFMVTLLPRAEDLFQTTTDLEIRSEVSKVTDELISIGKDVSANELLINPEQEPVRVVIKTGQIRVPYKISVEITVLDKDLFGQTVDIVTSDGDITTGLSLFNRISPTQADNLLIEFFGEEDWVPSIRPLLGDNTGTVIQALQKIEDLENSTPFGSSALIDAIFESTKILADNDIDTLRKLIYVFTDNDANLSVKTIDETLVAVNAIDGDKEVPILIGNLALVRPITLSVKASISDTRSINKLGFLTGGQSVTLVTEDDIDDIVTVFYSSAVGALGKGTFDFTTDLGEEVFLFSIEALFDLPDSRANGNWEISTSLDNLSFTKIEDTHAPNEEVAFDKIKVRYIRFNIILITGFSSEVDEYLTFAASPALIEIRIVYNASKTVFLFLNVDEHEDAPSQMVIAVDANNDIVDMEQIQVGLAKSDAHNWKDFFTDGQLFVDQNGKVVVPLRVSDDTSEFQKEPLNKVDRFTLKTSYGSWDPYSLVSLYDKDNDLVSPSEYKIYPRDGLVVMATVLDYDYVDGDFKIDVINTKKNKIGLRLTNKSFNEALRICGIGKMFTTGKSLDPPLQKSPPEVRNAIITTARPTIYSKIEMSYEFFDVNFDEEDTSERQIKWFINDVHINYLDNLTVWNDLDKSTDPLYTRALSFTLASLGTDKTALEKAQENNESILKVGDKVSYTIRVSDGSLLSELVTSNTVQVFQDKPVAKEVVIKGLLPDGTIVSEITANNSAIVQFNFQSDIDENETEITWWVEGEIFKTGKVSDVITDGSCPITQICPGEVSTTNIRIGLRLLQEIFVEVLPVSRGIVGNAVRSSTVVVKNSLPEITDIVLTPNSPNQFEDLFLRWNFFDFEVDALDDPTQTDLSEVKWFRKDSPTSEFIEVTDTASLAQIIVNIAGRNSILSNSLTVVGQEWFARVVPNDSLDDGIPVDSNTVTIFAGSN